MYSIFRPLLFSLDAERAHHLSLTLMRMVGQSAVLGWLVRRLYEVDDPRLAVEAFGLRFKNPVGLAAGYDKNGIAVHGLACLGFGHIEIGTVTRLAQVGNPKPRLHRVVEERGVINSLGFPNAGVEALPVAELQRVRQQVRLGVNIGKGKDTPLELAAEDYCELLRRVHSFADYVTVNVSSPNTVGLRSLQAREMMESLLGAVMAERQRVNPHLPVLVKIAPDLSDTELDDALAAITGSGADGVIATNTTVSRAGIAGRYAEVKGGLSGAPVREKSTVMIRKIAERMGGRLPIIGVGGVDSEEAALGKLQAGATFVQVYTGLVYAGPGLIRQINQRLLEVQIL